MRQIFILSIIILIALSIFVKAEDTSDSTESTTQQQEATSKDIKTFTDSFKWHNISTMRFSMYAISLVPSEHRAAAIDKLKTTLTTNVAATSDGVVTKSLLYDTLMEIIPKNLRSAAVGILSKYKY